MGRQLLILLLLAVCFLPAYARDDGRYAQSPLKQWFDSLKSKDGVNCCSMSDGVKLDDPDWEFSGSYYRVRIQGEWYRVPDTAVLDIPNRAGYTIVWSVPDMQDSSKRRILCFLPGAGL